MNPDDTLADQIRDAWLRNDNPTTRHAACVLSPDALRALATSAASHVAEHLDAKHRPLAVGDRVRVLSPVMSNGARTFSLAEGDIGTVIAEADKDGDIRLHRDGTEGGICVAAANVERIEDDPPRVGDIVRVDKAERADGETEWLPEVGKEYRVLSAVDSDGDLVTAKDDDGLHRIVDSRHVTVVRRSER